MFLTSWGALKPEALFSEMKCKHQKWAQHMLSRAQLSNAIVDQKQDSFPVWSNSVSLHAYGSPGCNESISKGFWFNSEVCRLVNHLRHMLSVRDFPFQLVSPCDSVCGVIPDTSEEHWEFSTVRQCKALHGSLSTTMERLITINIKCHEMSLMYFHGKIVFIMFRERTKIDMHDVPSAKLKFLKNKIKKITFINQQ